MFFITWAKTSIIWFLFYKQGHSQFRRLRVKVYKGTSTCDVLWKMERAEKE